MCLIAVTPRRDLVSLEALRNAQERNKDGWGIMWARDGKVVTARGMGGHNEFLSAWHDVPEDAPCAAHFRFATRGAKSEYNCHPFRVLGNGPNERDLFLMHNGPQAMDCSGDKVRSDTRELVEDILRPVLIGNPRKIRTQSFQRLLKNAMGHEKLVLLEGCGKWHIINKDQGVERDDGVWYSNLYSINAPQHKTYAPYNRGNYYGSDFWDVDAENKIDVDFVAQGFVQGTDGVWRRPEWSPKTTPKQAAKKLTKWLRHAERMEKKRPARCPVNNNENCLRGCIVGETCKASEDPPNKRHDCTCYERVTCECTDKCAEFERRLGEATERKQLPDVDAETERKLTWSSANVAQLSGHELLEAVQLDPEGAADFIGDRFGGF